ncbi:MAG: NAD(P)-dependent oxidoreductase [Acidobacteria bacterium]|nr:NAD(P)-dependent oxidoreductase [Acidobacteriota bacterium]
MQTENQLEEALSAPNEADISFLRRLRGDVMLLGAGGKMGPSLARRIRRAADAAGVPTRVCAVSRFSSPASRQELEAAGVETISCDLLDPDQVKLLPCFDNVLFLAGRKFGSGGRPDLTWAMNSVVPAIVARRFRSSRIVVFSTGNVYPFVSTAGRGSIESDDPSPRGEYAQSCLGRERVFEFYSREFGTPCLIYRLNYAVDLRYGVLVDIARRVADGQTVDVSVPVFNVIWQGDANSYALRSLELCESPPRYLNVTGLETLGVRETAGFFARRFGRQAAFGGEEGDTALLSNAGACHRILGAPEVPVAQLMEWVAGWIESGGSSLNKPTMFQVASGRF